MSHGQGKPQNGQGKVREFCEGSWLDTLRNGHVWISRINCSNVGNKLHTGWNDRPKLIVDTLYLLRTSEYTHVDSRTANMSRKMCVVLQQMQSIQWWNKVSYMPWQQIWVLFETASYMLLQQILSNIWDNIKNGHFVNTFMTQVCSYTNGLVQDCGISSAYALEIPQSCTEPML